MSVSRRDFAVLALTAAAAAPTLAQAPATNVAPAPPNPEAEARIASIIGRYGSRLTEEQKADIRRLITGAQEGIEAMRAHPLDNSIEPATLFRIHREPAGLKKVKTT